MDRICQYSTIIFASNVSVLLIVSVVTDYWEYRSFKVDKIIKNIQESNTTRVYQPTDTSSYLVVRYFWDARRHRNSHLPDFSVENTVHYQSPVLVYKYYFWENYTVNVTHYNGFYNETFELNRTRRRKLEDVIFLFVQYGNLYRECDSLESGVRSRLGLEHLSQNRCFNFMLTRRPADDYISMELPAVIHLERCAFVFALICIISSVISVVAGAYGSLAQEKDAILAASTAALISGMTLTVSIALFHGKCHLLLRREFLAGMEVPYKKILDEARTQQYGWSFSLAWICVVLCFVHTWVWLKKSQDMEARAISKRSRVHHKDRDWEDEAAILDL